MNKIVLKIDGMMCGMCESHMNDVIRKNFKIKKVKSSHIKNEVVVITPNDISDKELHNVIDPTGYRIISVSRSEAIKKGLFYF